MNEAVVKQDMHSSMSWAEKAKDIVKSLLPSWRVLAVEGQDSEVCRILDMNCGLDYLLCSEKSSLVFGLASRVQYNKNYRTFTVRKDRITGVSTEYDKRKTALAVNGIAPVYNMQMYIENDEISGLAITKTADLIKFIEDGNAKIKRTLQDKIGQAEFYICNWDEMRRQGYQILEYESQAS